MREIVHLQTGQVCTFLNLLFIMPLKVLKKTAPRGLLL